MTDLTHRPSMHPNEMRLTAESGAVEDAATAPLGERRMQGLAASAGIVIGWVQVVAPDMPFDVESFSVAGDDVESEVEAFRAAIEASKEEVRSLHARVAENLNDRLAAIFDYHLMILQDPMLVENTVAEIREQRRDAASLFSARVEAMIESFQRIEDPYFRARSSDLTDVSRRVLANLGRLHRQDLSIAHEKAVIVAHDLSPSDTAHLDTSKVAAFITDKGGTTSHSAILARSLHIPAVVGLERATHRAHTGQRVIVDAVEGWVIFNPAPETLERYTEYLEKFEAYERSLDDLRDKPAETPDGYHVDLAANIELPVELALMAKFGAESIGLYRTEFLFLEENLPTEEEQLANYKQALDAVAPGHAVTFRTLDIGGDKLGGSLPFYEEDNPYLGLRAVRYCMAHPQLFKTQLRALLRASALGRAKLMLPMISSVSDVRGAREVIYRTMEELDAEGIAYDGNIEIGIMIEVPSAALMADKLAREVDFFSIGTNDLIQYTLAVDRGNDLVAHLYNPYDPSVLRLISMVIESAHRNGIVANLCGEMAADPISAIVLLGMGIDELSLTSATIPRIKQVIRQFKLSDAREISQEILMQPSAGDVQRVIEDRIMPAVAGLDMPHIGTPLLADASGAA